MATVPTPPQTTDAFGATIVQILGGLATGLEAPVIEAAAEAAEPILAAPIVKQIFEAIVGSLVGDFTLAEGGGALKVVFTVQNDSKLYSLGKAALAVQAAQASGDPAAISTATQNEVNQWGNLIHWGGVSPVSS